MFVSLDPTLDKAINDFPNETKIKKLTFQLQYTTEFSGNTDKIERILQKCPNLKVLKLSFDDLDYSKNIRILKLIKKYCPKIESLIWFNLTDGVDHYNVVPLSTLKKLWIDNLTSLDLVFDLLEEVTSIGVSDRQVLDSWLLKCKDCGITFPKIEELHALLSSQNFFIGDFFPNLKKLTISRFIMDSDDLTDLQNQFKKLKKLDFISFENIGLINYIKYIPNVHSIQMQWGDSKYIEKLFDDKPGLKIYLGDGLYIKKELIEKSKVISHQCQLVLNQG